MPPDHESAQAANLIHMQGSATLLTYALLTAPDPLQAGTAAATLTLLVSNGGNRLVTCASIAVSFLVGAAAKDLLPDAGAASAIQTQTPDGWSASNSGGVITLTPDSPQDGQIGADGLSFIFAAVAVNSQPGSSLLSIDENATAPNNPATDRFATIPLPKFPPQFTVSPLSANPLEVAAGGATQLMWTGSNAGYTLQYDPGGGQQSVAVGNVGPYTAQDLTRAAGVVFTLIVEITVPGQDQPLVLQRQTIVEIVVAPPAITRFTGQIGSDNNSIQIYWTIQNADSCAISGYSEALNPQSGNVTISPPAGAALAPTYTLTAHNQGGDSSATVNLEWGVIGQPMLIYNNPSIGVFSPSQPYFYLADDGDALIHILDSATFQQALPPINMYGGAISGITWVPGEQLIVLIANTNVVTLANPATGTTQTPIYLDGEPSGAVTAPDGSHILIALSSGGVAAYSTTDWSKVGEPGTGAMPEALAYAPDGAHAFVICRAPGTLTVIDTSTWQQVGDPQKIGGNIGSVAVSPDNKYVFVTDDTRAGALYVLDGQTFQPLGNPYPAGVTAQSLAVTPDNNYIFILNHWVDTVTILDAHSFAPAQAALTVQPNATEIRVAPDGRRVVVINQLTSSITLIGRTGVSGGAG